MQFVELNRKNTKYRASTRLMMILPLTNSAIKLMRFFECLLFGLKDRGLLILLLSDVSPASVAGIFRGLVAGHRCRRNVREKKY